MLCIFIAISRMKSRVENVEKGIMKRKIFENRIGRSVPDTAWVSVWGEALFKWFFGHAEGLDYEQFLVEEQRLKTELVHFMGAYASQQEAESVAEQFFDGWEWLYDVMEGDLESMLMADPAARSRVEVIAAYPGFYAVVMYRFAHRLWRSGAPLMARLLAEYVHGETGIDIHPGAEIGERFVIDHGTGVVIGETTQIGHDVKIYQGVTLGALSVSKGKSGVKRHPTIGNHVVIYANATILGGDTIIGDHAVIGGNVWMTHSVPSGSMVYHKGEITIENKKYENR